MVEIKNVTKKFGAFTAIEDINLTVENGSIFGLVGYNGAGKTTLLKSIAGIYRPEGGEVLVDGRNTFTCPEIRRKMFFLPDEMFFTTHQTIAKAARYYAGYYPDFSFDTMKKLCEVFSLGKDAKLTSFSKGMLRQAQVIIAMSCMPRVLLLDEAFDGLDPQKRSVMNSMIIEYAAEKECSVIVSSHYLHEIADICDHVALLNGKKIALNCCVDDIGEDRCKFNLVFDTEKTADDFSGIEIKRFRGSGKSVTVSVSGNRDEAERKLREMNPLLIEAVPLSLEEIFLEEMEGTDYDFSEIFS